MSRPRRVGGLVGPSLIGPSLIGAAGAVAGTSLLGALHGIQVWTSAAAGALVAVGSWLLAERFRLVAFEWFTVAIGLFLLVGGPVVGLVPTPGSYLDFFHGISGGWADLLSTVPPTSAAGSLAAPPYLLAWLSTVAGLALQRRVRMPLVAMLGPIAGFAGGLLFSPDLSRSSIVQAATLLAFTLAMGRYQLAAYNLEPDRLIGNTTQARRRSRLLQAGLVSVAAVVVAMVAAPVVPGLDDEQRLTLRDRLEPPWEPLDEPSPLAQIKSNYQEEIRDDVVFVARGEVVPGRWALATLAAYDGTVWTVGDSELGGRAPFVSIEGLAPPPDGHAATTEPVASASVDVEIRSLDGPWLPMAGRLIQMNATQAPVVDVEPGPADPDRDAATPAGPTRTADPIDVRFNARTGTVAVPGGIDGLRYRAEVRPWRTLPADELSRLTFPEPVGLGLDGQAAGVRDWSADVVQGLDRGWDQVVAIRDELVQGGYLTDDRLQPGHSWARLTRFFADDEFYGNEEQYAAVAGIAARNAGLQARVVVGYVVDPAKLTDEEVAVTRGEASAWIEILTSEYGWLPVDVTPPRDNEPSIVEEGTRIESVAAPNPPPPPPPPPDIEAETPDEELDEDEEDDEDRAEVAAGRSWLIGAALGTASAVGFPVVVVAGWLAVMRWLKRRRRQRRAASEPADSVAGAWFELSDRLDEAGVARGANFSLGEQATVIGAALGDGVESARLADLVDKAAFSPDGVDRGDAARAWSDSDALVGRLQSGTSRSTRLRRLADPRVLVDRDPVS